MTVGSSPNGASFLQLNDAGWADAQREKFEEHFLRAFGVPVNRLIDPQRFEMGGIRVLANLLTLCDEDDVHAFQQDLFESLVEEGILERRPRPARVCNSLICRPPQPVAESVQVCPRCDKPIEDSIIREVRRSEKGSARFINEALTKSIEWELGKPKKFEGVLYYPLKKKGFPESGEVWVLFRERLSSEAKMKLQRSGQALLVVEPHTNEPHVYADVDGIGRVGLSYLIAAQGSNEEQEQCAIRCRSLMRSLLMHYYDRVTTAARHSYQHITTGTSGDKGHVYETDIFNVLRSMMPYTYQIGRESEKEPDGYVCVPVYDDPVLEGIQSWNWSYDAKHSDLKDGYDLDSGECDKIVRYIEKFRVKPAFADSSCKLRAHVIISNNIKESMIKKAATYVYSAEGGVAKKNRDIRLVLMRQEFVTRLYELVAEKRGDFERRRVLFGKMLVELLDRTAPESYSVLDASDAETLFASLLRVREVEKAMTEEELLRGLED